MCDSLRVCCNMAVAIEMNIKPYNLLLGHVSLMKYSPNVYREMSR